MAQAATTRTQFQEKLKLLLAKDDSDCQRFVDVYKKVKTCAENSQLVRENILQHDPYFLKHVEQGIKDLEKSDRPILVIGESSAGKSSFLNLLIGRTVLPELAGPCTHCMCCIKKGTKLEARVNTFDGSKWYETEILREDELSDEEFQDKLEILVNAGNCKNALDRCINIVVPSFILEGNVYLVDTPGFGDETQVTKSLVKYLPKAIGIIFILNTTVSYGMADDRGVLILNEIKRLHKEGNIPSFDPTKMIFIGNKWDQVQEKGRKDHRLKSIGKIKKFWPHFQEDQFLPLSVTYCKKNTIHEDYKSAIEDYQNVLDKIRNMVQHCCIARSQVYKKCLQGVFKHVKIFVDKTVTPTILSGEEKIEEATRLEGLVNKMESKYEKEKAEMEAMTADIQKKKVVHNFHQYLHNADNGKYIFPWTENNMPRQSEFSDVKWKAFVTIRNFIEDAFTKHIAMYEDKVRNLNDTSSNFTLKFCQIRNEIENLLNETKDGESCQNKEANKEAQPRLTYGSEFSGGEIAVLVVTAPLWIPVGLAVGIVGVVAVLPIKSAAKAINNSWKITKYRNDKRKYLDRWSKEIISEEYSKEGLEDKMRTRLTSRITEMLNCMEKSSKELKSLFHSLENKNAGQIPEGFYEIRDICHRMNEILKNLR